MRQSKSTLGKVYPWVVALCIFCVLSESSLYLLVKHSDIPIAFPTYSLENKGGWFTDGPVFGIWHKPDASIVYRRKCFSVKYSSNSYGARDRERSKDSQEPRVLMLGDSFIEGYGVDADQRMSDILERSTGMEHLNFGMTIFGLIQQALLYESLAMDFDHDIVIIGMLPHNDFKDDDSFAQNIGAQNIGVQNIGVHNNGVWNKIKFLLREYTFTYNALSYIKWMLSYKIQMAIADEDNREKGTYSGYYDYEPDQFMRARSSIEKIVGLAGNSGKNAILFTIPVYSDFLRYGNDPSPPPLHIDLEIFSKEIGFEYLDLLPFMFEAEKDWGKFFHTCDFHWNAVGNKKAAEILLENSVIYNKGHLEK